MVLQINTITSIGIQEREKTVGEKIEEQENVIPIHEFSFALVLLIQDLL